MQWACREAPIHIGKAIQIGQIPGDEGLACMAAQIGIRSESRNGPTRKAKGFGLRKVQSGHLLLGGFIPLCQDQPGPERDHGDAVVFQFVSGISGQAIESRLAHPVRDMSGIFPRP